LKYESTVQCPVETGIVFLRTDLNNFAIPASWKFVQRVSYATSLMRRSVLISTTEHLLSVFYSMGIDNAFVEIDNLEVPILDGSGIPFVRLIEEAGIQTSRKRRKYLRILRPVSVEGNGKRITIVPSESFQLTCDIFFDHPLVGHQTQDLQVTPHSYATELAPARTFGFEYELDQMRNMGLIRGASLENAVCFDRSNVLNPGGLRFPDECCRHIGRPLLGRVIAERAGHAMHVALVAKIMSDASLYELVTLDQIENTTAAFAGSASVVA
jgi:UDP-3-O-[3-hydroxymyristoyl] N-acetylglucosamine deacetylase